MLSVTNTKKLSASKTRTVKLIYNLSIDCNGAKRSPRLTKPNLALDSIQKPNFSTISKKWSQKVTTSGDVSISVSHKYFIPRKRNETHAVVMVTKIIFKTAYYVYISIKNFRAIT